jgi:hypothetical protein
VSIKTFPNPSSSFPLHTYLLGRTAIKQAVSLESSPPLHSGVARSYELPSGTSPGEFLMVFLTLEVSFFSSRHRLERWFGEEFSSVYDTAVDADLGLG